MVVGLVALSMLAWLVLDLVTTDPQPREPEVLDGPAPSSPPPQAGAGPDPDDFGPDRDGAGPDPDGVEPDADGVEPDDADADRVAIGFDGVCTVEVEPGARTSDPRPWDFDACERAPIELEAAETRWIVVLDSLAGNDFTETEALERLTGDQQLLWSGHYPSLNPDLWVVVDGPFADRAAATEAAGRHGGGAYPRELSDDPGDRYCVAADGCVGETSG